MLSTKRKSSEIDLQRRVKARAESEEETEFASFSSSQESGSDVDKSDGSEDGSESNSEEIEDEDLNAPDAASISFGALAKAQSSLTQPTKKRKIKPTNDDGWSNKEQEERIAGRKDKRGFSRTSKHAPTELSSKKAVSRRREVIPVPKRQVRDPRFEPTSGIVDDEKVKRNFSFLDSYRDDEMRDLRQAIKTTKDENAKERLKRELLSMESKKKSQARKDKEKEMLDKYRKEEKELVKQGKQPFYLKRSEQKQRVLVEQYGELKGRQLDKVIERRRKKVEGKEKKRMPFKRRGAEE